MLHFTNHQMYLRKGIVKLQQIVVVQRQEKRCLFLVVFFVNNEHEYKNVVMETANRLLFNNDVINVWLS